VLRDLLHFAGADARGANPQTAARALNQRANGLQIDVPAAFRHVMRVADPVTELRAPAANLTSLCHKTEISCLRILDYNNPERCPATASFLWRRICRVDDPEVRVHSAGENGRNEVILVVEDAETIRKMVCAMLTQSGYRCLDARDGKEALQLVQGAPDAIDLVLTDVMMPNMGGPELARRLAGLRPDLRIVFMSGYSDDPVVRTIERSPSIFLPKPFTAATLMEIVRQTLDRPWNGLPQVNTGVRAQ